MKVVTYHIEIVRVDQMRSINLTSYANAFKTLGQDQFKRYLEYFGIKVKAQESGDIYTFVKEVVSNGLRSDHLIDFFVGYSIPQISKEFDLLRIGHNYNLDIELKNISSPDKIEEQLIKNSYYLKALGTTAVLYTYVVKSQEVFTLDKRGKLRKSTLEELVASIEGQRPKSIEDIDALFKPSVYLVSPLNSTDKFMTGSYFLNGSQLATKNEILKIFVEDTFPFIAIEGKPGTGKTLLTYDIAKHLMGQNWKICIFHCGQLAEGHDILRDEHSWRIYPIKSINSVSSRKYDLIIVDETQRIYSEQLEMIIKHVTENNVKCIFSYDPDQVFTNSESLRNIAGEIEKLNHKKYKLTEKIRTNKEIAAFITNLFDRNKSNSNMKYKNIHLQYFSSPKLLKYYQEHLKEDGWEVINYTSSSYNLLTYDSYQVGQKNAHKVIGQEFDKVAAVINQHFYYDVDGKLGSSIESGAPGYRLDKMLYQMLTRARQEITIVVYKNESMLDACLKILGV
jgi:hypothetical protein